MDKLTRYTFNSCIPISSMDEDSHGDYIRVDELKRGIEEMEAEYPTAKAVLEELKRRIW